MDTLVNIYLDFVKAFDTVPHPRLIGKLRSYSTNGNTPKWIEAFLKNGTQVVKVNGEEYFSAPALSGIPQGSVLWTVIICDLPDSFRLG